MAGSAGSVEDDCEDGKASQDNILWHLPFTVSRRVRILVLRPPTSWSFKGHRMLPVSVPAEGQGQDLRVHLFARGYHTVTVGSAPQGGCSRDFAGEEPNVQEPQCCSSL